MPCSTVAEFLLQNMSEDEIEVIQNEMKVRVTGDQILTEARNDMQYA